MRIKKLLAAVMLTCTLLCAGCSANAPQASEISQSSLPLPSAGTHTSEISADTGRDESGTSQTSAQSSVTETEESSEISAEGSTDSSETSITESSVESAEESSEKSEEPEPSEASEESEPSEVSETSEVILPDEDITTVYGIEKKTFVNKLSDQEKKLFAVMYHAAERCEEKALFRNDIPEEQLDRLMWLLNYDCPELIHLKGDYSPMSVGFDNVSGVRFFYNMSASEYPDCRSEIDSFFVSLREQTEGMSSYEKEKYVYDMMFDSIVYNENTVHSGSVYGALIEHSARCEGISKAFAWCMNELGIECMTISGTPLWDNTSFYANHSWNIVNIDGTWYHVDLTADDLKTNEEQFVLPLYSFLNSDDETIRRTHLPSELYRKLGLPSCGSDELNYHAMNGLVCAPEDDPEERLRSVMDSYYTAEGECRLRLRFVSAESYESFIDNWETYYRSYLESGELAYRYATLHYNDVGQTICIYIAE